MLSPVQSIWKPDGACREVGMATSMPSVGLDCDRPPLPSPLDHPVPRGQEHCLGVVWRQEETGDPVWGLVTIRPSRSTALSFLAPLPWRCHLSSAASRSPHPATRCPPSVATTWFTIGSRAWPSACTGTCAKGRLAWLTPQTHQTPRTKQAGRWSDGPRSDISEERCTTGAGVNSQTIVILWPQITHPPYAIALYFFSFFFCATWWK